MGVRQTYRPSPQERRAKQPITTLVKKEDGEVDWTDNAERIERMVRAYEPWPGTFTHWDGKLLKILGCHLGTTEPPRHPAMSLGWTAMVSVSARATAFLSVDRLQIEGRRPSDAQDFVRGYPALVGSVLGRSS